MSNDRATFNVMAQERAAGRIFAVDGERPLLGRLRYLRLMDFPSPAPKGRGRKAAFGLDHFMQTLFALELINAEMTPTRAIRVMRTDWTTVKTAIAYGWSRNHGIGQEDRPFRSLVLLPSVLSDIAGDERAEDPLHAILGMLGDDEISNMRAAGTVPRRMLSLDMEAFSIALGELDQTDIRIDRMKFFEEMHAFCCEAFCSTDTNKWDIGA